MTEMRRLGIPLPAKHVDVLHASLSWEDFQVTSSVVERISAEIVPYVPRNVWGKD